MASSPFAFLIISIIGKRHFLLHMFPDSLPLFQQLIFLRAVIHRNKNIIIFTSRTHIHLYNVSNFTYAIIIFYDIIPFLNIIPPKKHPYLIATTYILAYCIRYFAFTLKGVTEPAAPFSGGKL